MQTYQAQIKAGKILAMLPRHKQKVSKALEDIQAMLSTCVKTYVSVSWGKDSIVMAHLVLRCKSSVDLIHWGSEQERHIANFDEVRDDFLKRFGGNYLDVSSDLMDAKLRNVGRVWSLENGYDGVFIGMTKEESRNRRMALSKADKNNIFTYTDGLKRCCPLANWTVEDITAYVAAHDLKMLNLYERFGMDIRTSSRIKKTGSTHRGIDYLSSTAQEAVSALWEVQ